MATMPPRLPAGQPSGLPDSRGAWFVSSAGHALIESENDSIRAALSERPGQAWLWLSPLPGGGTAPSGEASTPSALQLPACSHGLRLQAATDGWDGPIRCALPLPLANESVATVVIQHTARSGTRGTALIEECARVLVPGGRLWMYALNPLSPYRWRWKGSGLGASEPLPWRRRLREAGLQPDGVSQGLGPRWRVEVLPALQQGPGLRAAYLLGAEKRTIPLTPVRQRAALRLSEGVPAA
jgi:SAM-dependent methyltransferase